MYTARIVVLTTAPGAGGIAAYLARGFDAKSLPTEPVVQLQTVDVLVEQSDIGPGQAVSPKISSGKRGQPRLRATILSAATNGPKPPINLRSREKASTSFATASNAR